MVRVELYDAGDAVTDSATLLDDSKTKKSTRDTTGEQVGATILANLSSATKRPSAHTRHHARVGFDINRGTRVLTIVLRRAKQSKLLVYTFLAVLVLVILIVAYRRLASDVNVTDGVPLTQ